MICLLQLDQSGQVLLAAAATTTTTTNFRFLLGFLRFHVCVERGEGLGRQETRSWVRRRRRRFAGSGMESETMVAGKGSGSIILSPRG